MILEKKGQEIKRSSDVLTKLITDYSLIQKHNLKTLIKLQLDNEIDVVRMIDMCIDFETQAVGSFLEEFIEIDNGSVEIH